MARFVAMPIEILREHAIETSYKRAFAASVIYQTFYVVWHIPSVVARCAFGDEWLTCVVAIRCLLLAICVTTNSKTAFGVDNIFIAERALCEPFVI